jgi:glycosyltransferase involved in cell wall biosynthesis
LKILHLIKSLGRGGAEMLLPETIARHDRVVFDFAVGYFVPEKNQVVPLLEDLDVEVQCFPTSNPYLMPTRLPALIRFARQVGADIIHCHLPLSGVVGRLLGLATGLPVVYTEHNMQERYHPLTRRANQLTMRFNDRILTVSEEARSSLLQHLNGSRSKVQTLLNGVNTHHFNPDGFSREAAHSQLSLPTDTVVIGTIAVFRTQKRLDRWLRLAQRIHEQHPHTRFLLVGDGPEMKKLKELSQELGLGEAVYFPGRLEEVRQSLAAMDIYLMTSDFEGLPIALLEAMSMRLPVVATRVGGIPEVVTDGVEGFLSPKEDLDSLFGYLDQLIDFPELRTEVGRAARERVVDKFSIERMVGELEEVYRSLAM